MAENIDHLKYPVGKYQKPDTYTADKLKEWIKILQHLPDELEKAVANLNDEQLDTPYRDGGWTVRQLVHHIADSHINAYSRLKLALTEEQPVIKPYDEKGWAEMADSKHMDIAVSLHLLRALHQRICFNLLALQDSGWERTYYHPDNKRLVKVWEIAALYSWHSSHHVAHIIALRQRNGW